eukprot:TRINITY_DN3608_c0_g9_i1.p4 TRINITY_DN3608_c0_g9~~TRINITY_DN3608_c0_g9_i1.p4  ORF type:complete len:100 (+),score=40.64 TRINITY_DN3608_c0_g9_i1:108-407(+)
MLSARNFSKICLRRFSGTGGGIFRDHELAVENKYFRQRDEEALGHLQVALEKLKAGGERPAEQAPAAHVDAEDRAAAVERIVSLERELARLKEGLAEKK